MGTTAPTGARTRLRLPDRKTPPPAPARLVVICCWAAGLGLLGLPVAARASVAIIAGATPGWFEPTVFMAGVLGILLTVTAFAATHHRRLPWLLLAAATVSLATNACLAFTQ